MSIIPITQYGDSILRKVVNPVESIDDNVIQTIQDMFATMRNANGIGLAGNQVGLDQQLFVIDISPVEGYEEVKPIVMINPKIIDLSEDKVIMEEGCLSLPEYRVDVERPESIKVRYLSSAEQEEELEADDLFARVILHEYDHLIGKMIPDRVDGKSKEKYSSLLNMITNREVECSYPITDK
jgi:peptide deformylase